MWINLNNILINLSNIINISKSNKCKEKNKYLINFRTYGFKRKLFIAYETQEERNQDFEKILTLIFK
tara:strand:- start:809 stop:1009 length:201 start_codon:yes stop_codon:yes gene_type:complete